MENTACLVMWFILMTTTGAGYEESCDCAWHVTLLFEYICLTNLASLKLEMPCFFEIFVRVDADNISAAEWLWTWLLNSLISCQILHLAFNTILPCLQFQRFLLHQLKLMNLMLSTTKHVLF